MNLFWALLWDILRLIGSLLGLGFLIWFPFLYMRHEKLKRAHAELTATYNRLVREVGFVNFGNFITPELLHYPATKKEARK